MDSRNVAGESLLTLKMYLRDVDCEMKKMFGKKAFFINGNMFCGIQNSDFFMRFDLETQQEIMKSVPGVAHWEPRKGMKTREYLVVPFRISKDEALFKQVLSKSISYVKSLPVKSKR